MPAREPYSGAYRKLVLAFDVGTTYSGISYSILDPGHVPEIKGVTRYVYRETWPPLTLVEKSVIPRFPAQTHVGGSSKIPSIIYYDQDGAVRAVGEETVQENVIEKAEVEDWIKVEWYHNPA
jgi:hypothetical protein